MVVIRPLARRFTRLRAIARRAARFRGAHESEILQRDAAYFIPSAAIWPRIRQDITRKARYRFRQCAAGRRDIATTSPYAGGHGFLAQDAAEDAVDALNRRARAMITPELPPPRRRARRRKTPYY